MNVMRGVELNTGASESRLGDVVGAVIGLLRRRIWLLASIFGVLMVLSIAVIAAIPLKYEAVVRVKIDPTLNPMVQDPAQGNLNAEAIETEAGIMSSRAVAREVVRRLQLDRYPDFASGVGKTAMDRATDAVRKRLVVGRDQLSYIIAVHFKDVTPVRAAKIANTFAQAYLDLRVQAQTANSQRQAEFFGLGMGDLARQVNEADARLASYRAATGLPQESGSGTVADQQISTLSSQLATAEGEAASARSNAAVARAQLADGGADAVAGVQGSNVIRDLRAQRANIVREMGEIDSFYDRKHPESIRVHQQLAAVDAQLKAESARIVNSLQAQAQAAAAQVSALRATMAGLEQNRARDTRNSAEAERLSRDAASKRAQYDKMSALSLESTQGARSSIAQAEIIDRADPTSVIRSPKRSVLVSLAGVVSLSAGLLIVFVLEMMQGGLRTTLDVQQQLGAPLLGAIPEERSRGGRGSAFAPADLIGADKATMYSEALRNLRTSVRSAAGGTLPRIIAFTSAVPNEGKSATSLSFARMAAVNGVSTLLIDGDLRNSSLSERFPGSRAGLVEVLRGKATLDEAVQHDEVSGLDVLPVQQKLFTSHDIFADGAAAALFSEASKRYAQIIVDLPPILGVADARVAAQAVDGVIFVVRWGKTPPQTAAAAFAKLEEDGANILGAVYTRVNIKSSALGDIYFSKDYSDYYRAP